MSLRFFLEGGGEENFWWYFYKNIWPKYTSNFFSLNWYNKGVKINQIINTTYLVWKFFQKMIPRLF